MYIIKRLFIGLVLAHSISAHAFELELSKDRLKGRIAIAFEEIEFLNSNPNWSEPEKVEIFNDFAKRQALMECLSHQCGETSCLSVAKETHELEKAKESASLRVLTDMTKKEYSLRTRALAASKSEYYFTSIICTDQPLSMEKKEEAKLEACSASNPESLAACEPSIPQSESDQTVDASYLSNIKKIGQMIPYDEVKQFGYSALCLGASVAVKASVQHFSTPVETDSAVMRMCKLAFQYSKLPTAITIHTDKFIKSHRHNITPSFLLLDEAQTALQLAREFEQLAVVAKKMLDQKKIPAINIPVIEKLIVDGKAEITRSRDSYDNGSTGDGAVHGLKMGITSLKRIISFPTNVRSIDLSQVTPSLEKLIAIFPDKTKNDLRQIYKAIAVHSNHKNPSKQMVYFQGNPGTGKTYVAKGLAAAMGLEFLETTFTEAGLRQLKNLLGEATTTNVIVLIDEAGDFLGGSFEREVADYQKKDLFSTAKILLDRSTYYIKADSVDGIANRGRIGMIEILPFHDISKAIFIFTGNQKITDPAFLSRIATISFPRIDLSERQRLGSLFLNREFVKHGVKIQEEDNRILQEIIKKTNQSFDGVRELEGIVEMYSVMRKLDDHPAFDIDREIGKYALSVPLDPTVQ